MEIETTGDWLKHKGLSDADINFVETILTFTSTAKKKNNKLDEINKRLHTFFPDKKAKIAPTITLLQLNKVLQDNGIDVDVIEMLSRYREQGLCSNLCDQILES